MTSEIAAASDDASREATCGVRKSERIERAIADDVAFLEAHPTRRSGSLA